MRFSRLWFSAGVLGLVGLVGLSFASSGWAGAQERPAPGGASNPAATDREPTQTLARRVLARRDHAGLPFAIVDKRSATLTVFHRDGRPAGATPVLLGQAPGDLAPPGVGERTQRAALRPADRTTPAGRYTSEPGRNLDGEAIVWLDYDSALAIHRLRPGPAQQRRTERLASPDPRERRVSAGCVVVPVAFYETVVAPILGRSRAIVYVMSEDVPTLEL